MHLRLADAPQIELDDGRELRLAARDAAWLAWLAIEGPTSRDRLAALLWPASSQVQARTTLRQRLFQLKKQLGVDVAIGSPLLRLSDGVSHDLADSTELLGDLHLPDVPELDTWLCRQREQRREHEHDALRAQAQAQEEAGHLAAALSVAQALLRREPLSEAAHRRVMRLHYLLGDRAAALRAFDACEQLLKDEVGMRPAGETLALLATIEQAALPAAPAARCTIPAAVLRPPRMVGREREASALQLAWSSGDIAAVTGEAGMGKSRLLAEFIDSHPGVVRAAGRPGDGGVPFATLARLLRAVGDHGGSPAVEPEARRQLARVLPELGEAGAAFAEGHRLQLRRALAAYLQAAPGLEGLVVDDLHFADMASLEMLQALIGEPDVGMSCLRWALAYRPAEVDTPLQHLQTALTEAARLAPVAVAPLDDAALAELVDQLGLGLEGAAIAGALRQRTGGNPLFVLETLKQAWVEQRIDALAIGKGLPKPMSVERLIDMRIGQLSPGALVLARVASIAGVDFTIGLAESVLGVGAMQFADALGELESAQVLKGTQFVHDMVFDAVLRSVPTAIAEHTHAAVARWLEQHEGEPARVAQHWISANQPTRSLVWLGQAAGSARHALRNKECLAFLELKAQLEVASDRIGEAFTTQLEAVKVGIDADPDEHRGNQRCDLLDGLAITEKQRMEAQLVRANQAMHRYDDALTESLALGLLARASAQGETRVAMDCHVLLAYVMVRTGRFADALVHAQACSAWIDLHGDAESRCSLHGHLGMIYARVGPVSDAVAHHERALALARQSSEPGDVAIMLGNLAEVLRTAGRSSLALPLLEEARLIEATHEHEPLGAAVTKILQQGASLAVGHYRNALRAGEEAMTLLPAYAVDSNYPDVIAILRMLCWCHLGQWARVQHGLAQGFARRLPSDRHRAEHGRLQFLLRQAQSQAEPSSLDEVLALQPDERSELRQSLLILRAPLLPTDRALVELEAVRCVAARMGFGSHVLATHVASAQVCVTIEPLSARAHALKAMTLAQEFDLGSVYPGELFLRCAQAFMATGDEPNARISLERGSAWLAATVRGHVPDEFRDGFLHRHPANTELLALAARHGIDTPA